MDGLLRMAHRKKWGGVGLETYVRWDVPVLLKRPSVQRTLEAWPAKYDEVKGWPQELIPSPPGSTRP